MNDAVKSDVYRAGSIDGVHDTKILEVDIRQIQPSYAHVIPGFHVVQCRHGILICLDAPAQPRAVAANSQSHIPVLTFTSIRISDHMAGFRNGSRSSPVFGEWEFETFLEAEIVGF